MATPLQVLILKEQDDDPDALLHELRQAGFAPLWNCAHTEIDFLDYLQPKLDLILSAYSLSQFDVFQALLLLKERRLDIPLIVVAGRIGELVVRAKANAADGS